MSPQLRNGTSPQKNTSSCSRVLKSKENINKLKCNKTLKKKLKKYKLRKDGQEDPDIINVSQTLITSLKIKSPNNQHIYPVKITEENRHYNYLTKMVKMKGVNMMKPSKIMQRSNNENGDDSISPMPKNEQDKKQMDAFKFLMDSRNKTIGSNSPGKEKCLEEYEEHDTIQKKELKAKRMLSLNKMAQAKGSLKKIEIEEYREENIKKKINDRAKRFKHMIDNMETKNNKKQKIKASFDKIEKNSTSLISLEISDNGKMGNGKKPILKTFDLFDDPKDYPKSNINNISKEDEEFLNKLSPSIRKKENMLCYFQKVNKDSDRLENDNIVSQNTEQVLIKVKLKPKKVKKKKKVHITANNIASGYINQDQYNMCISTDNDKKRKRKEINSQSNEKTTLDNNETRPKRNTKKPVKYVEDFQLTSSDEELHIFTPKKKRKNKLYCESTLNAVTNNTKEQVKEKFCKTTKKDLKIIKKKSTHIKKTSANIKVKDHSNLAIKKATKLAPIFVAKPQVDSATIEAKQKFLHSGVPTQLKKTNIYSRNVLCNNEFQTVVHIQSLSNISPPKICNISYITNTNIEDINLKEEKDLYSKLLHVPVSQNYSLPKLQINVDQVLQDIKKSYPKFPVYRTYHLLRGKSKGEFNNCIYPDLDNSIEILNNVVDTNNVHPDKLSWVDKYKPTSEKQVIGNFESIKELRRWLVSWTENNVKSSKRNEVGSDSSDFYQSDTDSREILKNENNLLIITGKVGTGKTQSVYAVAAELAIKVIEVNASSKRTGKIILQDLQEATQSHKVDRGKNSTECSQKSQEINMTSDLLKVMKKRGRKKKSNVAFVSKAAVTRKESTELTVSQENIRTGMSLILIDDADVIFDQDDGFCYAISQLIQSSKRPVILVTTSLTCPHLQKFSCLAKIIKMQPFLPRMLGTWLDILCLVDNNMCSPGLGAKTLNLFQGDIRKTINYLQFYMTSHKHMSVIDDPVVYQSDEVLKVQAEDENSCMLWRDNEGWEEKYIGISNSNDNCKYFETKESLIQNFMGLPNIFYFWWNLPKYLNYPWQYCNNEIEIRSKSNKIKETKELITIANVLDNMSVIDYLGIVGEKPNITSKPWQSFEIDSVIDNENLVNYDRNNDYLNEISWELVIKSIVAAGRVIDIENKNVMNYPSLSMQRERDRVVSRHTSLTKCLNPSTALDRRALAIDYWPACRTICRSEKSKTDNNNKRNNRFCHYLKSLNIACKNDYFDNLAESLSLKK